MEGRRQAVGKVGQHLEVMLWVVGGTAMTSSLPIFPLLPCLKVGA